MATNQKVLSYSGGGSMIAKLKINSNEQTYYTRVLKQFYVCVAIFVRIILFLFHFDNMPPNRSIVPSMPAIANPISLAKSSLSGLDFLWSSLIYTRYIIKGCSVSRGCITTSFIHRITIPRILQFHMHPWQTFVENDMGTCSPMASPFILLIVGGEQCVGGLDLAMVG